MDRDEAIRRIGAALKKRSGKPWSVTGGRGTTWGWITIDAPPRRRLYDDAGNEKGLGYHMSPAEREELGKLLGLGHAVHFQGESVPAGNDYRQEYVDRAEGRPPSVTGMPYWD